MKDAIGSVAGGIRYHFAHATHRGMVRELNEDVVAVAEDVGLALIADGMGGYNAGEVASGLAAEFLVTHLADDLGQLQRQSADRENAQAQNAPVQNASAQNASAQNASTQNASAQPASPEKTPAQNAPAQSALHSLLRVRVDGANDAIIDAAHRNPELSGMGTTLALLLFTGSVVTTVHVGDSRVYRLRDGGLSLLTRDHSLLQEQIDAGVLTPGEARMSINRNFVTRALGVDVLADPEINEYDLAPGDLYLICSDGLPDMLSDEEIYDLLRGPVDEESDDEGPVDRTVVAVQALQQVAANLVDAANRHGGRDNVSVVLASVGWSREQGGHEEGLGPRTSLLGHIAE